MDGLIERLLTQEPFRASDDGTTVAELPLPGKLRNPDGPEAADALQSQSARIAELEGALEPFAEAAERIHESTNGVRLLDEFMLGNLTVRDIRRAHDALTKDSTSG